MIWQFGNLVPLAHHDPRRLPRRRPASTRLRRRSPSRSRRSPSPPSPRSSPRAPARGPRSADAWITGVVTGIVRLRRARHARRARPRTTAVAEAQLWQAVLFPTLVFAVPALARRRRHRVARRRTRASIARLRDRIEALRRAAGRAVPGLIVRGAAVAIAGLIGLGALVTAVALVLRGGQIVALYEAGTLRRARRDRGHARPARLPADLRRVGALVRRRTGVRARRGHLGLARRHPGRRRARRPGARGRAGVDDALAAAARPRCRSASARSPGGSPGRGSPPRCDRPPRARPGRAVAVRGRSDGVPGGRPGRWTRIGARPWSGC